ncbi:hypothetical protein GE09DRAFT_1126875, partial [Coniochaeta sp. 2T2.1]
MLPRWGSQAQRAWQETTPSSPESHGPSPPRVSNSTSARTRPVSTPGSGIFSPQITGGFSPQVGKSSTPTPMFSSARTTRGQALSKPHDLVSASVLHRSDTDHSHDNDGQPDESSAMSVPAYASSVTDPQSLVFAPSGRPYRQWNESGQVISTYGALFPDHYMKWKHEELPWICPVRSCRRLFPSISALGNHFKTVHRGCCLNDNLDGTFTELDKYADRTKPDINGSLVLLPKPPIVVSTGLMSSRGFPLAAPEPHASYQENTTPKKRARDDANDDASQHGCASWDDDRGPASRRRLSEREKSVATSDPPLQRLVTSHSGHPYIMWPDESGVLVTTYGALLPHGYKLDDSEPGRPWICPVRSCQHLFDL